MVVEPFIPLIRLSLKTRGSKWNPPRAAPGISCAPPEISGGRSPCPSSLPGVRAADRLREDFDREAFPHFREIFRAALRLTRRAPEAEDLVQEVFLQAWKSFNRFQSGTNCRAWLYRILWNVHHQRLRKKVPIPLGAEGEARLAETLAAEPATPTEILDDEVRAALDALSPEHRAIVLLSDVEELTYKEIAQVLKVPIGTVMSRLSRARAALREKVREAARGMGIAAAGGAIHSGKGQAT